MRVSSSYFIVRFLRWRSLSYGRWLAETLEFHSTSQWNEIKEIIESDCRALISFLSLSSSYIFQCEKFIYGRIKPFKYKFHSCFFHIHFHITVNLAKGGRSSKLAHKMCFVIFHPSTRNQTFLSSRFFVHSSLLLFIIRHRHMVTTV